MSFPSWVSCKLCWCWLRTICAARRRHSYWSSRSIPLPRCRRAGPIKCGAPLQHQTAVALRSSYHHQHPRFRRQTHSSRWPFHFLQFQHQLHHPHRSRRILFHIDQALIYPESGALCLVILPSTLSFLNNCWNNVINWIWLAFKKCAKYKYYFKIKLL